MSVLHLVRVPRLSVPKDYHLGDHVRVLLAGSVTRTEDDTNTVSICDWSAEPTCPWCARPL